MDMFLAIVSTISSQLFSSYGMIGSIDVVLSIPLFLENHSRGINHVYYRRVVRRVRKDNRVQQVCIGCMLKDRI